MDIIIRLIEFLIQALVEGNRRNQAPAPRAQSRAQPSTLGSPARNQPLAPRTPVAPQGPVYDDEGWRRLVAWLGIIVLVIMLAVWLLYINGYLSGTRSSALALDPNSGIIGPRQAIQQSRELRQLLVLGGYG